MTDLKSEKFIELKPGNSGYNVNNKVTKLPNLTSQTFRPTWWSSSVLNSVRFKGKILAFIHKKRKAHDQILNLKMELNNTIGHIKGITNL